MGTYGRNDDRRPLREFDGPLEGGRFRVDYGTRQQRAAAPQRTGAPQRKLAAANRRPGTAPRARRPKSRRGKMAIIGLGIAIAVVLAAQSPMQQNVGTGRRNTPPQEETAHSTPAHAWRKGEIPFLYQIDPPMVRRTLCGRKHPRERMRPDLPFHGLHIAHGKDRPRSRGNGALQRAKRLHRRRHDGMGAYDGRCDDARPSQCRTLRKRRRRPCRARGGAADHMQRATRRLYQHGAFHRARRPDRRRAGHGARPEQRRKRRSSLGPRPDPWPVRQSLGVQRLVVGSESKSPKSLYQE